MKASLIIPCFNQYSYTRSCLKDLAALPDDHEIILVDDGSTDTTKKLSLPDFDKSEFHKNLEVFRTKETKGFAKSSNLGYAKALGDYIIFLNNDIKIRNNHATWTQPLIEAAKNGALVGPTVGVLDSNLNFICECKKIPTSGFAYLSGWNLTAHRNTFSKLILPGYCGPFTEEFQTYYEDTDLGLRAKELNIPLVVVDVPIHHIGKVTTRKVGMLNIYSQAKVGFIGKWKDRVKAL